MKRLSITFDDDIYEMVCKLAKKNNKRIKDIVMSILREYLYRPEEYVSIELLSKNIQECLSNLEMIKRKQNLHYDLSVQEFVNHGYLSNASPKESISYQAFLDRKKKFND